jgi:hypothetical protein
LPGKAIRKQNSLNACPSTGTTTHTDKHSPSPSSPNVAGCTTGAMPWAALSSSRWHVDSNARMRLRIGLYLRKRMRGMRHEDAKAAECAVQD